MVREIYSNELAMSANVRINDESLIIDAMIQNGDEWNVENLTLVITPVPS